MACIFRVCFWLLDLAVCMLVARIEDLYFYKLLLCFFFRLSPSGFGWRFENLRLRWFIVSIQLIVVLFFLLWTRNDDWLINLLSAAHFWKKVHFHSKNLIFTMTPSKILKYLNSTRFAAANLCVSGSYISRPGLMWSTVIVDGAY